MLAHLCTSIGRNGVAIDRIVGFEELGGIDDFTTIRLERRLEKAGEFQNHVSRCCKLLNDCTNLPVPKVEHFLSAVASTAVPCWRSGCFKLLLSLPPARLVIHYYCIPFS
jgi:hypothetical protein